MGVLHRGCYGAYTAASMHQLQHSGPRHGCQCCLAIVRQILRRQTWLQDVGLFILCQAANSRQYIVCLMMSHAVAQKAIKVTHTSMLSLATRKCFCLPIGASCQHPILSAPTPMSAAAADVYGRHGRGAIDTAPSTYTAASSTRTARLCCTARPPSTSTTRPSTSTTRTSTNTALPSTTWRGLQPYYMAFNLQSRRLQHAGPWRLCATCRTTSSSIACCDSRAHQLQPEVGNRFGRSPSQERVLNATLRLAAMSLSRRFYNCFMRYSKSTQVPFAFCAKPPNFTAYLFD
eukprot:6186456-Pleurochrysis_carterae.AAC.1